MPRTSVETQLAKLRKAKAEIEKKEKALLNKTQGKVIDKIVQLAVDNKISAAQIAEALKSGKPTKTRRTANKSGTTRGKVAPKYRNPANPEQTWTGRGRSPLWVQDLQKSGTLESALIKSGE
jgi:DNA-binding protein H-NS